MLGSGVVSNSWKLHSPFSFLLGGSNAYLSVTRHVDCPVSHYRRLRRSLQRGRAKRGRFLRWRVRRNRKVVPLIRRLAAVGVVVIVLGLSVTALWYGIRLGLHLIGQ